MLLRQKKEKDLMLQARRFNDLGKVVYLVVVIVVNIIFWWIAIAEFLRPPEEYL